MYTVEFEIMVTNSGSGWTSIFHFTAGGDGSKTGDRLPALFLNSGGFFHICSAIHPKWDINGRYLLGIG